MSQRVSIVEVGPRDGLQNESEILSLEQRLAFIKHLADSGLKRIEVGAFVSPKWVPQMEGSADLINELYRRRSEFPKDVRFSALVPNVKGMIDALSTPIEEIAIFGACTESFSRQNTNCSISEGLDRFTQVTAIAKKHRRKARGYLSVAFGCPYEGPVKESTVVSLAQKFAKMGVYEVVIGDTIGVATPNQVKSLINKLKRKIPVKKLAMHFHDTRGTALANVTVALASGIRVFDSSFGGLGGCPYARGASGNLATDDLVYMLNGMGFKTGVNLAKLLEYVPTMENQIGHKLPSRTAAAGLPRLSNV